jgi:hypothetical protein
VLRGSPGASLGRDMDEVGSCGGSIPAAPLGIGKGFDRAGLDTDKVGIAGGSIDDALLSPVSRRLLVTGSDIASSDRSRLRLWLARSGALIEIPICCLRAISFENIDGRSAYSFWIRSIGAKSTKVGHSITGRGMLL